MTLLPKLIFRFTEIPFRIPTDFFVQTDKLMLKFKGSRIAKTTLKKKNKVGGLTLPNFKTYYRAMVIQVVWYQPKARHLDQWNRSQSPEINPYICAQPIFDKGTKTIQ